MYSASPHVRVLAEHHSVSIAPSHVLSSGTSRSSSSRPHVPVFTPSGQQSAAIHGGDERRAAGGVTEQSPVTCEERKKSELWVRSKHLKTVDEGEASLKPRVCPPTSADSCQTHKWSDRTEVRFYISAKIVTEKMMEKNSFWKPCLLDSRAMTMTHNWTLMATRSNLWNPNCNNTDLTKPGFTPAPSLPLFLVSEAQTSLSPEMLSCSSWGAVSLNLQFFFLEMWSGAGIKIHLQNMETELCNVGLTQWLSGLCLMHKWVNEKLFCRTWEVWNVWFPLRNHFSTQSKLRAGGPKVGPAGQSWPAKLSSLLY